MANHTPFDTIGDIGITPIVWEYHGVMHTAGKWKAGKPDVISGFKLIFWVYGLLLV